MASVGQSTTPQTVQHSAKNRVAALLTGSLVALLALRALLTFVLVQSLLDAHTEDYFGGGNEFMIETDFGQSIIENWRPDYTGLATFMLVLGALLAGCAFFVARGALWARIVGIVISLLTLVLAGAQVVGPRSSISTPLFIAIDIVIAVTAVAVIIYLALPRKKVAVAP